MKSVIDPSPYPAIAGRLRSDATATTVRIASWVSDMNFCAVVPGDPIAGPLRSVMPHLSA